LIDIAAGSERARPTPRREAPANTPISVDVKASVSADQAPLVVMCAGSAWTGVTGSDHHIARELTRFAKVLWVDPPVSFLKALSGGPGARRVPRPRLTAISSKLLRLTPVAPPGHSRPGLDVATEVLVRAQIRWALRRLGARPYAVVACMLDDVLTGWEPGVVRVFYGTDDFAAGAELMGLRRKRLLRAERRQVGNSDIVIAVSQMLADRWSDMGAKARFIPNGVQVAAYRDMDSVTPAAEVSLPEPVVGVIGHLSARIDIDVLEAISDAGCSLLLVGPHDASWVPDRFAALVARSNVTWVGRREFSELPGYLKRMNVGLTPYANTTFNQASFPLKTLEYLAAGLPVVSTDLPATRWLNSDLVRVAAGPKDFARAVFEAAGEADDERMKTRRREFADKHSWERRAEELAATIGLVETTQPMREAN
jgi:glycosyltransferase involved in cell wall biosynthesis